jgi:hypothetical protein
MMAVLDSFSGRLGSVASVGLMACSFAFSMVLPHYLSIVKKASLLHLPQLETGSESVSQIHQFF